MSDPGILGTIFRWLAFVKFNATPPTAVDGDLVPLQCDIRGNLLVNVAATGSSPPLPLMIYATPGSALTRTAAWMRFGIDTLAGVVTAQASASAQFGDELDFLDAGRSWGTHAFTFHGGSYLVQDPFDQSAPLGATYVTQPGFSGGSLTWILMTDTTLGTYWKAF